MMGYTHRQVGVRVCIVIESQFRKIQKLLKLALNEAEKEAINDGVDITSPEYDQALLILREKILEELGLTPEQYEELRLSFKTPKKAVSYKELTDIPEIPPTLAPDAIKSLISDSIANLPKPTTTIINKVVKETIREKPITKVIKELRTEVVKELDRTQLDELGQDLRILQSSFTDLYDKVGQIKIPDYSQLQEALKKDSADHITGLWGNMPDFRMLGMGLQGQIDELKKGEVGELTKALADTYYAPISEPLSWLKATAQTGLTGDKTGSFKITTTGDSSLTGTIVLGQSGATPKSVTIPQNLTINNRLTMGPGAEVDFSSSIVALAAVTVYALQYVSYMDIGTIYDSSWGTNLATGATIWALTAQFRAKQLATPVQSKTLTSGATTLAITSNVVKLTGHAAGNTLATITGGVAGQLLTIIFTDALVTITDTDAATANTINLSAAFTSIANDTLTLVFDGTKWFEVARSIN